MERTTENTAITFVLTALGGIISGAVLLCALSFIQKLIISAPISLKGFIIPFLFGGVSGFIISLWGYRLKQSNKRLKASVLEKEVLLKELDHRVKNNLQLVSSLFNLSSTFATEQQHPFILKRIAARINVLHHIHEVLFGNTVLERVKACDYLTSIIDYMQAQNSRMPVVVHCEVEQLECNFDYAVPIGLIVFEILSNSYQHAFPENASPGYSEKKICFSSRRLDDGNMQLKISDNGIGFSYTEKLAAGKSLGVQLIQALSQQVHARVEFNGPPGAEYTLIIPLHQQ